MKMKKSIHILMFTFGILISLVTGSDSGPMRLSINLCEEPLVGQPVRLCCKTEGLGKTGLQVRIPGSLYTTYHIECQNHTYVYYRNSHDSQYDRSVQVQCYTKYDVTVYAFTLTERLENDYRTWSCETYSGLNVRLTWNRTYKTRFTESQGITAAINGSDASFRFDIPLSYNVIQLYRKYTDTPITEWKSSYYSSSYIDVRVGNVVKYRVQRNYGRSYVYVYVLDTTPDDAGTYWLAVDKGLYKEGKNISKTLVLYDSPSEMVVQPQQVSKQGSIMAATLYCDVTVDVISTSIMASFRNITYTWVYPDSGSTYQVSNIRDNSVRVTGIDCSMYNLAPIGCIADLFHSDNTSQVWYHLTKLCEYPVIEQPSKKVNTTFTSRTSTYSIVMSVLAGVMFLVGMGCFIFAYRKSLCTSCKRPSPFERTRNWWRNRRRPEDNQPLEVGLIQNEESSNPEHGRSLSSRIHDRRQLNYTIQEPATSQPTQEHNTTTNRQGPFHTPMSGEPAFRPDYNPSPVTLVPNASTGGYGQIPVTVSPVNVNTGPGHVLGQGNPSELPRENQIPGFQQPLRVELPTNNYAIPDHSASLRQVNRNEQFAAEAEVHLETLHRSLRDDAIHIEVTRGDIVDDVMNFYTTMDQSDARNTVYCKFVGEPGLDVGGVTRDVFTTFWQKAIPKYFTGNIALVPKLSLQTYDNSALVTLGRIFAHSTALLKAIPVQICRSTLNVVIFGEMEKVTDSEDIIIDDFLLYVNSDDRAVLEKGLAKFDNLDQSEESKLRDIFANYGMPEIPRQENFRRNLATIAHNELCIKPKVACDLIGKGIPEFHRQLFWGQMTILHIDGLYQVFRPTPQKVVDKLKCRQWPLPRNSPERKSFDNLKRFVTNLSTETLMKFLHFVTGERKIPTSDIIVEFTNITGVSRTPIAHTCSCLLELPKSYTKYEELRSEFFTVLESEEAFLFTQQ